MLPYDARLHAHQQTTNGSANGHHPPAPWQMIGQFWAGLFLVDQAVALPHGLHHLLSPRLLAVALIRYQEGTLRYDELIVASLARAGLHPGLYIQSIWVDDQASVSGGRAIWGLPKELATFNWQDNTVQVSDAGGPIATFAVQRGLVGLPPLHLPVVGIGRRDSHWAFLHARAWASLRPARLRVMHWAERFGYHLPEAPLLSLAATPFRAVFPPPLLRRMKGEERSV